MNKPDRINAAIRDCLQRCYESQVPLHSLAEFVGMLRANPDWREAEVQEVEAGVRQMLKGIMSPAE
jgi:hypothetical protein